jgi:hypothetical protein
MSKIVETDNHGGDYPDESFELEGRPLPEAEAEVIAAALNRAWCPDGEGRRYWKVVADDYVLQPGFEP